MNNNADFRSKYKGGVARFSDGATRYVSWVKTASDLRRVVAVRMGVRGFWVPVDRKEDVHEKEAASVR